MAAYAFVTLWRVGAPLAAVWEVIAHAEEWPSWWKAIERAEIVQPAGSDGLGGVTRFRFRTALGYKLNFETTGVRVEPPRLYEARAAGDLIGTGRWTLTPETEAQTLVRYEWDVSTAKAWMNRMAPIARPAFNWNHDVVMRWGAEGLARRLNASVRDVGHGAP